MAEADALKRHTRSLASLSERLSRVQQPESDVVERGDRLLEVEPLEHESERVRPQSGQLPIRRLRNVVANDMHTRRASAARACP